MDALFSVFATRSGSALIASLPFRAALGAILFAATLGAQIPNLLPEAPPAAENEVKDPYHRESPHSSFLAFVNAMQRDDNMETAAHYLQLPPKITPKDREEFLRQFRLVLDRRYFSAISSISKHPAGSLQDGLDRDKEMAGVLTTEEGPVDIILTRVDDGDNGQVWLVSKETLAAIPKIYEEIAPLDPLRYLPKVLSERRIFSIQAGILLVALILVPIAYALAWILILTVQGVLRYVMREGGVPHWLDTLGFRILIAIGLHGIGVYYLGVPLLFRYYYGRIVALIFLFVFCLLLFRALDGTAARILRVLRARQRVTAISFVALGQRVVKVLIALSVTLIGLSILGVDLSTALAAIGIGGLAIALAAQKTLENLFGGASIIADEAMQVGDFCKIGDTLGTIEDIGLRSTRIRTLDRTTVTTPNAVVAGVNIENYSRRDKFWFHPTLSLRYETTAAQLREVLSGVRVLLEKHPRVESESARIRFTKMGAYSLDLEIFSYVSAIDMADFLGTQEGLLLQLMEIVEGAGAQFAFPSQTTYLARDSKPG